MTELRPRLASALRGLQDYLRPAGERSPPETGDADGLRADDVRLDAHAVLRQQGVGVELVLVDVRGPASVARQGAIPGARRTSIAALLRDVHALPDDPVVIVGDDDGDTATAALRLRALGHGSAWALAGGLAAWVRAGGEVEPA